MDGLRLTTAPLVPEVRLFLAEDPTILWARLEADAGRRLPPPYWASAWMGGQAVARYVLDNPGLVADRRVLDLASGSGMVAIAAALAGAATVVANDVDAYAGLAIRANAHANGVAVAPLVADLLDGRHDSDLRADVVLAGDALYNDGLAGRLLPVLTVVARRGARVIVGDPGRGWVPHASWKTLATYDLPAAGFGEDAQLTTTSVLMPAARPSEKILTSRVEKRGGRSRGR
jgi:predicted nicotinamide N-methyase